MHSFSFKLVISLFLTNAPTYFKEVLKFDIQTDGFLSSIPYALLGVVNISAGLVSDKFIVSKKFSKNNVRKFFTVSGISCYDT